MSAHIKNLGTVASMLAEFGRQCEQEDADAAAFHAPSECGALIHRSQLRSARLLRRRICAIARANKREVMRQLDCRCDARWLYNSGLGYLAAVVLGDGEAQ